MASGSKSDLSTQPDRRAARGSVVSFTSQRAEEPEPFPPHRGVNPKSFPTILVGPSGLFREGMESILHAAGFHVAGSNNFIGESAINSITKDETPLLIIDAGNNFDVALEQLLLFNHRWGRGRSVVLADDLDAEKVNSAVRAGANAYFSKAIEYDVFIRYLDLVILGETILSPELRTFMSHRNRDDIDGEKAGQMSLKNERMPRLSLTENSIMNALIAGHPNKIIARHLNIAESTVKVHVKTIIRKLGVHNRTQAAIWGVNNGPFPSANREPDLE